LAEIETREGLAELQGGYVNYDETWAPNHIELFESVLDLHEDTRKSRSWVHPVVARVAERWADVNGNF
jgi:hypothetical protein